MTVLRRCKEAAGLATLVATVALSPTAHAGLIEGRAHSDGYGESTQAACCAKIIVAAQDNAAEICRKTGGFPDARRNPKHGQCEWDQQMNAEGYKVFKCSGYAALDCKSP